MTRWVMEIITAVRTILSRVAILTEPLAPSAAEAI